MKKYGLIFTMFFALALITTSCNFPATAGPQPSQESREFISQPGLPTPPEHNDSTPAAQSNLYRLVKAVNVTPVGNLAGGAFVRVGYVPGKDRIAVTFSARLSQPVRNCTDIFGRPNPNAIAYREYTMEMQETGNYGIITCQTGPDVGGMFHGDDYYYAAMGHDNTRNVDGWYLAKYNAVTWQSSVSPFFYPLATEEKNGDPMIAVMNGQIDISGKYKKTNDTGPGYATHHQLFTPDLQFVDKHILTNASHIDLTSLLAANGKIDFITSTDLWGDMIVMQYDTNWSYLGIKSLKQHASAPEGAAFDGTHFYVSYIDNSLSKPEKPGSSDNIRLAAFDSNWNLIDDVAVTSFVPDDHKAPARPSLTLHNNRIYVCYDQAENVQPDSNQSPENTDIQVYVKAYDLSGR